MVAAASLIARVQREYAEVAASLPAHVSAPAQRRAALEALARGGLPTNRDENWRYASLRPLERVAFRPLAATPAPIELQQLASVALPAALPGCERFVFVDGGLQSSLSASLEPTASRRIARTLARAGLAPKHERPDARFGLLADMFAVDTLTIEVPAAGTFAAELVYIASGDSASGSSYPRIEVRAAAGSRVMLIERHVSAGDASSSIHCAVDLTLEDDAVVEHVRWQNLNARSLIIDTMQATLAARANYSLRYIATGGSASRSTLRIGLEGREAQCDITAACVADGSQVLDVFAEVEHAAPGAATRELFRGIASGRSKVAFNGKMIVAAHARGASSEQSLKSLLAGPEAEIAARPQLEIYTDDVRASHGATAGKLDDTMLFYLLSRGIDRETAQSLLKWAFVEDALTRVAPALLRREIEQRLAARLKDVAALDGLLEVSQ